MKEELLKRLPLVKAQEIPTEKAIPIVNRVSKIKFTG